MSLTFRRQKIARRQMVILDLTTRDVADGVGCTQAHLSNVLQGRAHPSELVRERLPLILGLPIAVLLDAELLEGEYSGRRGGRARTPLVFSDAAIDAAHNFVKATEVK